ncbi:hypothetical protein D1007_12554 [Hordeum vulgare]|nr:hypothetical protein D1007_12554 [Hordeum vulgare]
MRSNVYFKIEEERSVQIEKPQINNEDIDKFEGTRSEGESNVIDAVVPATAHPASDGAIVVVDLNLQADVGDAKHDKVAGDDPVVAAEILPVPFKKHLALKVLDMYPKVPPLVGLEPHHTRELHRQPLLHHLNELGRDDEHGEILLIHDLHVKAKRLSGPLLMADPRSSSPRMRLPHEGDPTRQVQPLESAVHGDTVHGCLGGGNDMDSSFGPIPLRLPRLVR